MNGPSLRVAVADCAPIVIAHELGYFKKFGIDSVVSIFVPPLGVEHGAVQLAGSVVDLQPRRKEALDLRPTIGRLGGGKQRHHDEAPILELGLQVRIVERLSHASRSCGR